MSVNEEQRAYDLQIHRTPSNLVLDSSTTIFNHQANYLPSATTTSTQPAIVLPSRDFSSQSTSHQSGYDFELPFRRRYEAQNQARRVSVADFDSLSGSGEGRANQASGPYHSQDHYQQAVAQFQARRSRSQPPRPETAPFFSQQTAQQAPANMRYVVPSSASGTTN